ncbi:MAG: outer membrane beta-barrel protein [Parashewanella sp.]
MAGKIPFFILLSCFSFIVQANAQKNYDITNPVIGVRLGYQLIDGGKAEPGMINAEQYGIDGGVNFYNQWQLRLGYQFGRQLTSDNTGVQLNTSLLKSELGYRWELATNTSLFTQLGAVYWNLNKALSNRNVINSKGFSPLAEVGFYFQLRNNFSLDFGYQYINKIGSRKTGTYNSNLFFVGLIHPI